MKEICLGRLEGLSPECLLLEPCGGFGIGMWHVEVYTCGKAHFQSLLVSVVQS